MHMRLQSGMSTSFSSQEIIVLRRQIRQVYFFFGVLLCHPSLLYEACMSPVTVDSLHPYCMMKLQRHAREGQLT